MPSFGINQWFSQIKTNRLGKEQLRVLQREQDDAAWYHQQTMQQLSYQSQQLYRIANILEWQARK